MAKKYVEWGAYNTTVGVINTNAIGQGKTNTIKALTNPNCFYSFYTSKGTTNTIWTWLKENRDNNLNNCNDWFIPSTAELIKLHDSGIEKDYIKNTIPYIWASSEYNPNATGVPSTQYTNNMAYRMNWYAGTVDGKSKPSYKDDTDAWGCIAIRSF